MPLEARRSLAASLNTLLASLSREGTSLDVREWLTPENGTPAVDYCALSNAGFWAPNTLLMQPRWAMSFLRGPMTLGDVRKALGCA